MSIFFRGIHMFFTLFPYFSPQSRHCYSFIHGIKIQNSLNFLKTLCYNLLGSLAGIFSPPQKHPFWANLFGVRYDRPSEKVQGTAAVSCVWWTDHTGEHCRLLCVRSILALGYGLEYDSRLDSFGAVCFYYKQALCIWKQEAHRKNVTLGSRQLFWLSALLRRTGSGNHVADSRCVPLEQSAYENHLQYIGYYTELYFQ